MSLFNETEICQDSKAEGSTGETLTVKAHARKKKRTVDELAKNPPVKEIAIAFPKSMLTCDKCSGPFKLIGKKFIRRKLIIIPQSEKVLETVAAPMPATGTRRIPTSLILLPLGHRLLL